MSIVGSKLDSLEYKLRAAFENSEFVEIDSCNEKVRRLTNEVENLLNEYRAGSLAQTDSMRRDLLGRLAELTDVIKAQRDEEKRESLYALQSTSIEIEQAIEGLERFNYESVRPTGQDDFRFDNNINNLIHKETEKFIEENNIKDVNLQEQIRRKTNSLGKSLITTHETLSVKIKNSVRENVDRVGAELVAEKEKAEVAKVENPKGDNVFASKLSGQTVSQQELAESDARDLNENEKAFRGSEPRTTTRKDLEAMFK